MRAEGVFECTRRRFEVLGWWMDGVRAAGVEPAAALGRSVGRRAREGAARRVGLATGSARS